MTAIDYKETIPNNVNLSDDRRLQRALEKWQPAFLNWWDQLGPEASSNHEIFLRTAIDVSPQRNLIYRQLVITECWIFQPHTT